MKRVLTLLIAVLLALNTSGLETAYAAPGCAASLMPAFTAYQATILCKSMGSAIGFSQIPAVDNSIDLGSAAFTWRTLYTGTSIIAKTSEILRVRQDPNRLFTFDGSSDTALTLTFGDGTTAVQKLTISAATADAADDGTLQLCGGGAYAADGSRGACIILPGEEVSGGSDISYVAGGGDTHIFYTGSTQTMSIGTTGLVTTAAGLTNTTGATTNSAAADFIASTSGGTLSLQEATAGATCMGSFTANGITQVDVTTSCATTGSRLFFTKTSTSTVNGSCYVFAAPNNTLFSVKCLATDTGTYNYIIIHEAP